MANANLGRNLGRNFAILRYPMQLIGGTGLVWVIVVQIKDFYGNKNIIKEKVKFFRF